MPPQPTISVIIPVLNEAKRIAVQIERLKAYPGFTEIIVVDGGSEDRTVHKVEQFPDVRLIHAPRGRAFQMNVGAEEATGDIILFLHADVVLPEDAVHWIYTIMKDRDTIAGAFKTWTVTDSGRTWVEPFLHFADMRSRYSDLPYGDQGIFLRRLDFFKAGRYRCDLPLFEDLDFSVRLKQMGNITTAPSCVMVSGRRFIARPIVNMLIVNILPLFYRLGVPADVLVRIYTSPR